MEILHVQKLRLFAHMVQVGDDLMLEDLLHNHCCAGERSWLASVERSWKWVHEQVGQEKMPIQIECIYNLQGLRDMQSLHRELRKAIHQAKKAHMIRIKTWCDLKKHADFQKAAMFDMNCSHDDCEQVIEEKHVCEVCQEIFPSQAAVAVHASKKHKHRIAMRRFAKDACCRVCCKFYHTRSRLLQHLQYGSTMCWAAHCRAYNPLSELEADGLDEQDRLHKQAHHQRGHRSLNVDKQWRWSTEAECRDVMTRRSSTSEFDLSVPLPEEVNQWSSLGTLPTGQGGRDKTVRKLQEARLKHVIADTCALEAEVLQRVAGWTQDDLWIPRPLSEGRLFALIFCSGHRRWGDIASWISWQGRVTPITIDLAVDSHFGNAHSTALWEALIRARKVVIGHAGPPCETYSMPRWIRLVGKTYPRPLRDASFPWGMPERTPKEVQQCHIGTSLMLVALRMMILIFMHGGCFSLEHPKGPNDNSQKWCVWFSGFVRELLALPEIQTICMLHKARWARALQSPHVCFWGGCLGWQRCCTKHMTEIGLQQKPLEVGIRSKENGTRQKLKPTLSECRKRWQRRITDTWIALLWKAMNRSRTI